MWLTSILLSAILSLSDQVRGQSCHGINQYRQCSLNAACGCLPLINTENRGICGFLYITCSELVSCAHNNRICYQPGHVCVNHPRCQNAPLCYPENMAHSTVCPPVVPTDGICATATWNQIGVTVAGGHGRGESLNQLDEPLGSFVDDDAAVYVVDTLNSRVVKWLPGASSGQLVLGGNGQGNETNQFHYASDITIDKKGTIYICDHENRRVQQFLKNDNHGQTIMENILCWGLALANEGSLYISDWEKLSVIKWPSKQVVAGGKGVGSGLTQLSYPGGLFVDQDQSVFVADNGNHRIIKWSAGAKEGVVVAGHNQLYSPESVIADQRGNLYVVDHSNHITRWLKDSTSGSIIIDGHGNGTEESSLTDPADLKFDRQGNLYVVDREHSRVQKFAIDKSSCSNGF